MAEHAEYEAPASAEMAARQNSDDALRLLLAQRRLHSRAKKWQSFRWIGLVLLGVAAPFVSVLIPGSAVAVGAVTGLWLFVGRTVLAWFETRSMTRAAAIQELLDLYIFKMPATIERTSVPSLEDIAVLAAAPGGLRATANKEKLLDWYPIAADHPGSETVAIAQRANASYTGRLIRTAVWVWAGLTLAWLVFLTIWSSVSALSFGAILLGVIFPVLPAALDVVEYLLSTWRAAQDREDLANTIQSRIEGDAPILGQELVAWQVQMYDLRRTTPQAPDWLYNLTRSRNEAAMHAAADELRRKKQ
ncbi:S-4TM family putative pore-forming effector [Microbacterium schleiferi]|uniref:S-4TM family putative pore-forming effector n=1 Tax=Microbacterium schleiferi TaxID=69362 RepID=UPI001D1716C6|nr:S-4TM family putative pore-forming effector [Microbacterium schleiferi]MCC4268031.1 hypothetical protein [Microbacterium schleiferi]|tara:strand:+ start:1440 stop:2351 length:912 start_codon:yes stop_codon:yes gene_type:complete